MFTKLCVNVALSAFTDLAFSIYPGIVIWNLNMPKWKRINVIALMGLGIVYVLPPMFRRLR